ncbi:hypothetical protein DEO72_LG10g2651 [Vigna unguiculata]|uniref:Uncharacterized protein n=1 Tax=Vigna unguiculata TaxID=3917 RepID=A0A4D6NDJ9_VIGUN|nr:hypothetical protein DEO72_LG10g2651 [Vigna unguiculata]
MQYCDITEYTANQHRRNHTSDGRSGDLHEGVMSCTQPYQRRKEWRFARRGNELLKVVAGERGRKNRKGLSRQLVIVKLMRK